MSTVAPKIIYISQSTTKKTAPEQKPAYDIDPSKKQEIIQELPAKLQERIRMYEAEKKKAGLLLVEKKDVSESEKVERAKLLKFSLERCKLLKSELEQEASKLSSAFFKFGTINSEQGNYEEGLKHYQKVLVLYQIAFIEDNFKEGVVINNMSNVYLARGEHVFAERGYRTAFEKYKNSTKVKNSNIVNVLNGLGNALLSQAKFDEALQAYEEAQKCIIAHTPKTEPLYGQQMSLVLNNIANLYLKMGKLDKSLKYDQEALLLTEEKGSVECAFILNNMGCKYRDKRDFKLALEKHKEALKIYKVPGKPASVQVAITLDFMGIVYYKQKNYGDAIKHHKQALDICNQLSDKGRENKANILHNLSNVYYETEEFDKALDVNEEALKIRVHLYGENSLQAMESYFNRANIYIKMDKIADAIQLYEKIIKILLDSHGENSDLLIHAYINIANAYFSHDKYNLALEFYNKALHALNEKSAGDTFTTADVYMNMGSTYNAMGKFDQALRFLRTSISIYKDISHEATSKNRALASAHSNLGTVLHALGKLDEALENFNISLELDESLSDTDNSHTASSYMNVANIYVDQNRIEDAMSFYDRALDIFGNIFGENSSHVADVLCNVANVLSSHRQNKQALKLLQRAYKIFKNSFGEEHSRTAMVIGAIGTALAHLKRYDEAYESCLKAANVFKKLFGSQSESSATAISNLGVLFVNQKQFEKALPHFQEVHKIRNALVGPEHHDTADSILRLASAHLSMANSTDETENMSHCQAAATLYEDLLATNNAIIEKRMKEFITYDFIEQNKLLNILSKVYVKQGKASKAAELYYIHAERYKNSFPIVSLYYCLQSIHLYYYLGEFTEEITKLNVIRAEIAYHYGCLDLAISTLQKVAAPKQDDKLQKRLLEWQNEKQKLLSILDKDIYDLLENCQKSYLNIQIDILKEMETAPVLSDHLKNKMTQIFIKINSILDIAFGRFAKHAIFHPNGSPDFQCYFPCNPSQDSFIRGLKDKQIYVSIDEFEEDTLKTMMIPRSGDLIRKALKQFGYLDKNGRVTAKSIDDPPLVELDDSFDPIRRELAELLRKKGLKENVSKQELKAFYETTFNKEGYQAPPASKIVDVLVSRGYVTIDPRSQTPKRICKVTEKFKIKDPDFRLALNSSNETELRIFRYERQILRKIARRLQDKTDSYSLERSFPKAFAAIAESQPFHYYASGANNKMLGFWKLSWLEKVLAISNGGKHIGLIPQALSGKLAERVGSLYKNQLTIFLLYVEPTFYPWTFVPVLKEITDLADDKLIRISAEILKVLYIKSYIQKGMVIHPLALAYLESAKKTKDSQDVVKFERKFLEQLKIDLPKSLQIYAENVANLLLQRVSQFSFLELRTDSQVEFHSLFERALHGTRKIVTELGQARHELKSKSEIKSEESLGHLESKKTQGKTTAGVLLPMPKAILPVAAVSDVLKPMDHQAQEKIALSFKNLFKESKAIQESDYLRYHQWLTDTAAMYRKAHHLEKAGDLFFDAYQMIEEQKPYLALNYLRKAVYFFRLNPKVLKKFAEASLCLSELYIKQNLWYYANLCLQLAIDDLGAEHSKILQTRFVSCVRKYNHFLRNIDTDIYSQLEHCKYVYLRLQTLSFKQKFNPSNSSIRNQLEMGIVYFVNILRHVLDQAFTRFVHIKIYLPNNKWVSIHIRNSLKFYAFSSEKDFKDELVTKEILSGDKLKKSLERDFPEIWNLLLSVQAFSKGSAGNLWLAKIIELSNKMKHEGVGSIIFGSEPTNSFEKLEELFEMSIEAADSIIKTFFAAIADCSLSDFRKKLEAYDGTAERLKEDDGTLEKLGAEDSTPEPQASFTPLHDFVTKETAQVKEMKDAKKKHTPASDKPKLPGAASLPRFV